MEQDLAIARLGRPCSNFSLRIRRICLIESLFPAMRDPSLQEGSRTTGLAIDE